jgi:hypothetical protein
VVEKLAEAGGGRAISKAPWCCSASNRALYAQLSQNIAVRSVCRLFGFGSGHHSERMDAGSRGRWRSSDGGGVDRSIDINFLRKSICVKRVTEKVNHGSHF